GGWFRVKGQSAGKELRGWVSGKYVRVNKATPPSDKGTTKSPKAPAKPFQGSLKKRKDKLKFIHDPKRSTVDLLGAEGASHRSFSWHRNDYPGSPAGPNEKRARDLVRGLKKLCPERRVNTGPHKLPFDWTKIEPKLSAIPGQKSGRLHNEAAKSYGLMRAAAAKDGVHLKVLSAVRSPKHQKRLAKKNKNGAAVAQGVSTHNYGLAIDLALNPGYSGQLKEISTRPFSNVMDMRSSPVHKWMFFFAKDYGWYPYSNEPWHWEYNPESLKKQFP
ncbi:MAG: D-alanyl-D-alanine carboxypeptidase family protein, partial [Planctomycetota bacterium]|nr:D-alanyl-D-alanine carboxypeptidase family protein [Planctomycetota bacterium]